MAGTGLLIAIITGVCLFAPFDASTKADIWVAVGTLALAIITWWSLSETKAVVAAEDRRHEQSFAPLLTIGPSELSAGNVHLVVSNAGRGIAQRVLVLLDGEFRPTLQENYPPIPIPPSSQAHHVSVVAAGGVAGIHFPLQHINYRVHLSNITVEYADMFGNEYVTEYRAFSENPNDMRWQQPQNLNIPKRTT